MKYILFRKDIYDENSVNRMTQLNWLIKMWMKRSTSFPLFRMCKRAQVCRAFCRITDVYIRRQPITSPLHDTMKEKKRSTWYESNFFTLVAIKLTFPHPLHLLRWADFEVYVCHFDKVFKTSYSIKKLQLYWATLCILTILNVIFSRAFFLSLMDNKMIDDFHMTLTW